MGKRSKDKTLFGHPGEGREVGGVAVGTVDGKALPVKEFYMIHNGEKKDFTAKVTDGVIKTDKIQFVLWIISSLRKMG